MDDFMDILSGIMLCGVKTTGARVSLSAQR